jgi:ankyrin repeat protein
MTEIVDPVIEELQQLSLGESEGAAVPDGQHTAVRSYVAVNAIARSSRAKVVNVDQVDADGMTPLMKACFAGRLDHVHLLLQHEVRLPASRSVGSSCVCGDAMRTTALCGCVRWSSV